MTTTTYYDRVKVSVSGTPGTGVITIGSAATGYQSFSAAGVPDQAYVSYTAEDGPSVWEYGHGTYSASGTTFTRTNVIASSAGVGVAATLSSAAILYVSLLAEDFASIDSIPSGGTTGQVLTKNSSTNYDTVWATPATGSSSSSGTTSTSAIVQSVFVDNHQADGPVTGTLTSTPTVGNVLLVLVDAFQTTALTVASGWQLLASSTVGSNYQAIIAKTVTSADTTTTTPATDASRNSEMQIYELSGTSVTTLVATISATNTSVTTTQSATVTTTTANELVIFAAYLSQPYTASVTGATEDGSFVGYDGNYVSIAVCHTTETTAGSNTLTMAYSNQGNAGDGMFMVVVVPASSSSTSGTNAVVTYPPFSPPLAANFQVLQDDGTHVTLTDDTNLGLIVSTPANTTSQAPRTATKTRTSSGAWSIKAKIKSVIQPENYGLAGLAIYQSGGPVVLFGKDNTGKIYIIRYNTPSGYSSTPYTPSFSLPQIEWLRMDYDGTNLINFYISADGENWMLYYSNSQGTLTGGTADHFGIGFMIGYNFSGTNFYMSIPNWTETGLT